MHSNSFEHMSTCACDGNCTVNGLSCPHTYGLAGVKSLTVACWRDIGWIKRFPRPWKWMALQIVALAQPAIASSDMRWSKLGRYGWRNGERRANGQKNQHGSFNKAQREDKTSERMLMMSTKTYAAVNTKHSVVTWTTQKMLEFTATAIDKLGKTLTLPRLKWLEA